MSQYVPLREQLAEIAREISTARSGAYQTAVEQAIRQLRRGGIERAALREGDIAPELILEGTVGSRVSLSEWLDRGPVVATFFRGAWCPFCNLTLRALHLSHNDILRLGAQILAISLEPADANARLADKLGIRFPMLSDPEGRTARLFGVLYHVPAELAATFRAQGIDLPSRQASHRWVLPLAATYVIDQDGVVRFSFVEADPAERADPAHIISALKQLKR